MTTLSDYDGTPEQDGAPAASTFVHATVLRDEVVQAVTMALQRQLELAEGSDATAVTQVVDCTLGGGGHSEAILGALPQVSVLGLDRDPAALRAARERLVDFGARFQAVHARFSELSQVVAGHRAKGLLAIVADLGVSSHQFDTPERGFSFRFDGPLDMRMDPSQGATALELLQGVRLEDLADVLYQYGDIHRSIGTARIVLEEVAKGATTTARLAERLAARLGRTRNVHPATQVFQALRMWVNTEDSEVDALLAQGPGLLAPGGALAVISFHSGEDRPVKRAMAELGKKGGDYWLPRRKPTLPGDEEVARNPRARSAHLRVLVAKGPEAPGAREADSWEEEHSQED